MFYSRYSFATYYLMRFGSARLAGLLLLYHTKAAAPRIAQYDGLWRTC